jgi:hypothetical protein
MVSHEFSRWNIYDKVNNTCQNQYRILYQLPTNINPRASDPLADIGYSGW